MLMDAAAMVGQQRKRPEAQLNMTILLSVPVLAVVLWRLVWLSRVTVRF